MTQEVATTNREIVDPFNDPSRCPWCSESARWAHSGEWQGRKPARYCVRCDLVFTQGAKREWDDAFFNPNHPDHGKMVGATPKTPKPTASVIREPDEFDVIRAKVQHRHAKES